MLFKIQHGSALDEFVSWLLKYQQEPHYPGVLWKRWRGTESDMFELWGHEPLLVYAKLKWANALT